MFGRLLCLTMALFLAFSAAFAGAQGLVDPPPARPKPLWAAQFAEDPGGWPSPDAACKAQHDHYNPNARLKPISYFDGVDWAECDWEIDEDSNTVLPSAVRAYCIPGYTISQMGSCVRNGDDGLTVNRGCGCAPGSQPPIGPSRPSVGNPVSLDFGAKVDREVDYMSADGRFGVVREYYSLPDDDLYTKSATPLPGFGARWHGVIPGRLIAYGNWWEYVQYVETGGSYVDFVSDEYGDGTDYRWHPSVTGNRRRLSIINTPTVHRNVYFTQSAVPNGPAEVRMDMSQGEYILFRRAATLTRYGRTLVPIEHGYADGYKIFYSYPDTGEFPSMVSDSFGRQMTLTWQNANRLTLTILSSIYVHKVISEIGLPDGTKLKYQYDEDLDGRNSLVRDRLQSVQRLSSTGTTLWSRSYLHENSGIPHAMTGKLDQNGNRLSTYAYDAAGLAASTELAGGVDKYTIVNKEGSSPQTFNRFVTNPLGYKEEYVFRMQQRALNAVNGEASAGVDANVKTIAYDGWIGDLVVSEYGNQKGVMTHYYVDDYRRPYIKVEAWGLPDQRVTRYEWHNTYDLVTKVERPGLTTQYSYSATGLPLTRTETDTTSQSVPYSTAGQTRAWTYGWNGNGRLTSIDGPKGVDAAGRNDIQSFTYDASGNLLTDTDAAGNVTTFGNYDANGRPGKMTDANGIETLYAYDALGRVSTVTVKHPTTASANAVTSFEYDNEGRVKGVTLPATDKLIVDYDLAGRAVAVRATSGERIDYGYDAMSNVTAETVKRGNGTSARSISRTFDGLGRMLTETLGVGRTTSWKYDKTGMPVTVTSARSHATQQAFDALDRMVSTLAPDAGATTTAYDPQDGEVSFKDAIDVTTTFVRNGFGEVIQEVSPDRGSSTYYYDAAGDRVAEIDGRNSRVDIVRDALGRITRKTPVGRPASEIITYTYDTAGISGSYGKGRLATVVDATGTTRFKYDHRGNLLTKQQAIGSSTSATLQFAYDLADRVTSITYPSGRVVSYARDSKGRVSTVKTRPTATGADVTLASAMTYEPFGSLLSATLGNGLSMSQSWGNDGRLASKRLYRTSGGTNLSLLTYGYDNDDNITSITNGVDATRNLTHGYDSMNRLTRTTAVSGSVKRQDFLHDRNGNRTRVEDRTNASDTNPAATATYTLQSGTNRLASVAGPSGTRSITYDARGNTIGETRPGAASVTVGYDGYGRLTGYQRTGLSALTHGYNGLDDRVSVTTGSDTRRYVFDGDGRMLGEYGASASDVKAETIWLSPEVAANDNQPFGGDDGVGGYAPLAVVTGGAVYWTHGNHLGVPLTITDASGTVATPTGYTRVGFPGQTQTLDDLYYNRHRDYDPTIGRYIQADPIGLEGGANLYGYGKANPLRWTDPKGLSVAGTAGGVIGGIAGGIIFRNGAAAQRGAIIGRAVGEAINSYCFDDDISDRCRAIYAEIDKAVGWINRKEREQANGRISEIRGHHKALIGYSRNLADKVRRAKNQNCLNFNPDARRIIRAYLGYDI